MQLEKVEERKGRQGHSAGPPLSFRGTRRKDTEYGTTFPLSHSPCYPPEEDMVSKYRGGRSGYHKP